MEDEVDVVVVGAGLAGLAAAHELEAAGLRVQVVEARDRVGGRTLNHALGSGEPVEIGGQWVGPTQDRILAMARRLGVLTYPTYQKGWHLLSYGGRVRRFRSTLPPRLPPLVLADFLRAMGRLGRMARAVPPDAPWTAERAGEWDSLTLEAWSRGAMRTEGARSLLRLVTTSVLAAEPREASLLHVLFYVRSGGYGRLLSSAQRWRFVGGSQEISLRQAGALRRPVRLSSPVTSVAHEPGGVVVAGEGFTVRAGHAVVTVPPGVAGHVRFDPDLPAARAAVARRATTGSVIKYLAVYEAPFWRAAGLSGQASADTGLVRVAFDNTPHRPDGTAGAGAGAGAGVLVAFAEADDARALRAMPGDRRRRAVLHDLARFFGPRAAQPVDLVERDWSGEAWSGGCYGAVLPPGAWTEAGPALRPPVGRVHWAGAESSTAWAGYMDGAVRSGERAAAEIVAARRR